MTDHVRCYLLEPTDKVRYTLRRFCWTEKATCPGSRGYHNAEQAIGIRQQPPPGGPVTGEL